MIVTCENCDKKFEIDSNLIPDNGRLLQCSSCNYEWFFKRKIIEDPVEIIKEENNESIRLLDETLNQQVNFENNTQEVDVELEKEKIFKKTSIPNTIRKKFKILNLLIVFIISFVALIIILDTFKSQIDVIFPNIEIFLYHLYESFNDIVLFTKDLF
jgi:predicted Zn finger-like uncharacterized protein